MLDIVTWEVQQITTKLMEKIYDVNSLYPFVMLNDMPLNIDKKYSDMSNIKLEDFFGFCEAEITSPSAADNIINPLLPYKHLGKTIFPFGSWKGTYCSFYFIF